jgi:LysM repeat protein
MPSIPKITLSICIFVFLSAGSWYMAKGIQPIRTGTVNNLISNSRSPWLPGQRTKKQLDFRKNVYLLNKHTPTPPESFRDGLWYFCVSPKQDELAYYQPTKRNKRQAFLADSSIIHLVKKGETLYSIANKYDVTVDEIKRWNHLTHNTIKIGEKLKIYPLKAHKSTATKSTKSLSNRGQNGGRYAVKSGDTLFRIAQMFHTSVKDLKALNHLTSNTIRIGQKLKVRRGKRASLKETASSSMKYGKFTRYTLQKTQSLNALLAKFHMGKMEFHALNPDFDSSASHKGERIEVLMPAKISKRNPYRVKKSSAKLGMVPAAKYNPDDFGPTTTGELYNPEALTAGSPDLKIGTVIFLKNKRNGRGVLVRINDRTTGNGLKLSKAAWQALGLTNTSQKIMAYRIHE